LSFAKLVDVAEAGLRLPGCLDAVNGGLIQEASHSRQASGNLSLGFLGRCLALMRCPVHGYDCQIDEQFNGFLIHERQE
jgi:hypothetical protein